MFRSLFQPALRCSRFLPTGVDVHCHLLPGVDDGAADVKAAFAIIEAQQKAGLHAAICTPHIMARYRQNTPAILSEQFEVFRKRVETRYPGFTLHLAAEYMLDEQFLSHLAQADSLLTLPTPAPLPQSPAAADAPGTRYLLVELPQYMLPPGWANMLKAIRLAGLTPVLAHPERYHQLLGEKDLLSLHRQGVRLQGNVASLGGYYGEAAQALAETLRSQNLYSWWGTDAHATELFTRTKLRP